ncbi:MAG TPA: zinc-dependent alcohol dehydrogenase [Jiangellaceae bacterium]|nr:zinc-dependent alcohol dehydrogenase [Jiangellaceae bacterium]
MKAVRWHGVGDVRVEDVPDPVIQEPTDAIIRVTSTAICGSDLHLYSTLGMYLDEGDVLGHEAMGIVEDVGAEVAHIAPGDRVVIPFNISCGRCFMCERDLYAQCETTQVTEHGKGAALFGYTKLYGSVPGGQADRIRVPQAHFGPITVPDEHPDERFLYLSDILPTAWQAVADADIPAGGSVAVFGLGPVGQFAARIALRGPARTVIGIEPVPERIAMAQRWGVRTIDPTDADDVPAALRELTAGRGPDAVIDAVGMEAHGAPVAAMLQRATGFLPDPVAERLTETVGVDRMRVLHEAIDAVRRGGTVSVVGVYGGAVDPMPMMQMFDKGITIRMGQAHVRRWTAEIMPLLVDEDLLGTEDLATHRLPLTEAPHGYEIFQKKQDGAIKVILTP